MQIQVKCSCGAENCREWVVVELQGTVELNPSFFQTHLQNLQIGQICRLSSSSQVHIKKHFRKVCVFSLSFDSASDFFIWVWFF
jgi:hypothetical protein